MDISRRSALFCSLLWCSTVMSGLAQEAKNQPAAKPIDVSQYSQPIRVACVGDSITFGAGIQDREKQSYPAQLQQMLGEKWVVKNFGVSGATMLQAGDKPYQKENAWKEALTFKPDVLIVKLGTNDTKPQNWKHQAQFAADTQLVIAAFREANAKVKIYLCLPVPAFPGRWGINEETISQGVIPTLKKVAAEAEVPLIDLHAALSQQAELFPDSVHPNAAGARRIAVEVFQTLTGQEAPANK